MAVIGEGEKLNSEEITDRINKARLSLEPKAEMTSWLSVVRALSELVNSEIVRKEETGRRATYILTERVSKEEAEGKNLWR